jgi:hypothetical protein
MLNQSFSFACLAWLLLLVWCVYSVYLYIIDWFEEPYVLLREEKGFKLQKASDTHASTYFYYCISVFSSMHDRWNTQLFYKMLRS